VKLAEANPGEPAPPPASLVVHTWIRHFRSFVGPAAALAYLVLAPFGAWWMALPFVLPGILLDVTDEWGGPQLEQPHPHLPEAPFNALLYVLAAIQMANVVLLARLVGTTGALSFQALFGLLLVMGTSGNGIVTAHELIHRQQARFRWLGRLLLASVLYEHFYTEHIRGHHVRVGTPEDPATARFGEALMPFVLRTVPAQFRSAWRIETKRLGNEAMQLWNPRLLRSRIVHGLAAEWALAALLGIVFGWAALLFHVLQAAGAIFSLEVVNYFEHWGLERTTRRVRPVDSWDAVDRGTLYGMIGLSRHADHHAHPTRPYQQLRIFDESPKLPASYGRIMTIAIFRNRRFQNLMTEELRRRALGPFLPAET
jgi:alkane 1-monooxygenase